MKNKIIIITLALICLTSLYINAQSNTTEEFEHKMSTTGFMQNKGQVIDQHNFPQPEVKYLYNGNNFKLHLRTNSFSYELYSIETLRQAQSDISLDMAHKGPHEMENIPEVKIHSHRIDIELIGANPNPQIIAEEQSNDYTNFYTTNTGENGVTEVYNYNKITYKNIYPNIDLVFYVKGDEQSSIKYDFIVHPGGNVNDIQLKYLGADKMELDGSNKLIVTTTQGNIEEQMPLVYEMGNENLPTSQAETQPLWTGSP